jgi:glycosyltransferase involved in cell wall biosynthesis
MEKISPILLVNFNSAVLSGGYRRVYEILRLGKSEGIEYIIVTDSSSCENATKIFPDYMKVLSSYKVYLKNFKEKQASLPGLKQVFIYRNIIRSALFVSRVALDENADLIIGGEGVQSILTSYLAGRFSSKPWTAIFQPTTVLLQPSTSTRALNVFNVLHFVNEKLSRSNLSLVSRTGFAFDLLTQLKVAEKSLMLSVSVSVAEELKPLNPKITFHVMEPGNGIHPTKFAQCLDVKKCYDAIFFARLIPEKGLFDLPVIWKYVTMKKPDALLAVAGITEDQQHVNRFLDLASRSGLRQNILFLGELDETALINSVKSSKLTLYPSLVDSFSLVTLESLACGTPVVAYDIPAIRHNFGKCDAVLRCAIKDKNSMAKNALSIIENEKLKEALSKRAKEYSTNYDWKNVVTAEKQAYFNVIEHFRSK